MNISECIIIIKVRLFSWDLDVHQNFNVTKFLKLLGQKGKQIKKNNGFN